MPPFLGRLLGSASIVRNDNSLNLLKTNVSTTVMAWDCRGIPATWTWKLSRMHSHSYR